MENELILKDFSVSIEPSSITINNQDELEKAIRSYSDQYKGLVVTAETKAAAKKVRAEMNHFKKALNDRRKEIKREYSKPLKEFEEIIGEYTATVDEVVSSIDHNIKELDAQERQDKRDQIEAEIETMAQNYQVDPSKVEIRESWLNKSCSHKKFLEEAAEDMQTLKKRESDQEAIRKYATDKGLPFAPYLTELETFGVLDTMKSIDRDVERQKQQEEARKAKEKANYEAQKERLTEVNGKSYDSTTGQAIQELQQVTFTVKGSKNQINELARYIASSGVEIVNASEREELLEEAR